MYYLPYMVLGEGEHLVERVGERGERGVVEGVGEREVVEGVGERGVVEGVGDLAISHIGVWHHCRDSPHVCCLLQALQNQCIKCVMQTGIRQTNNWYQQRDVT